MRAFFTFKCSPKLNGFPNGFLANKRCYYHNKDKFLVLIRPVTTAPSKQKVVNIAKDAFCEEELKTYRKVEVTFDNAKEAFKSKSNFELIRALIVFRLCSVDIFVRNNQMLLNSLQKLLGKRLFKIVAKATFYGHFLAGENFQEVSVTASNLSRFGVQSMLNYTVESEVGGRESGDAEWDKKCDQNVEFICSSIDAASANSKLGHKGFAAVKLTAIGKPELLKKLSEAVLQMQKYHRITNDSNSKQTPFESILKIEDQIYAFLDFGRNTCDFHYLSTDELAEFHKMMFRLNKLADYAVYKGVRLMIDAEQTYLQPAISKICLSLMRKYNHKEVVVMNTYQAYLKQTLNNICIDLQLAKRDNFNFGCKLVRGAYMDEERRLAKELAYEDPVNVNHEATNQSYHKCLEEIVRARKSRGLGAVMVMVASHNEDTVRHTLKLMEKYHIDPNEQTIYFGQLYGMCDQVTFPLGEAGYNIYKCLHYGPLDAVLPYLSRRAKENGTMLKNTARERELLWSELKRRIAEIPHKA